MPKKGGLKTRFCAALMAIVFACAMPGYAGSTFDSNQLTSEITAQTFYYLAKQITSAEDTNQTRAEQAIIFLQAALRLDKRADYVTPELFKLLSRYPAANQSPFVRQILVNYLKRPTDFIVIRNALSYLLNEAATREEREKVIQDLLLKVRNKNNKLDSQLYTMLGMLRLEVADANALSNFESAYAADKYNRLAYNELISLAGSRLNVLIHL